MATLDDVQPYIFSLQRWVVIESLRARMLSWYLYGTEPPDPANIVHEVQMRPKWLDTTRTGSCQLRLNQNLVGTEACQVSWDISSGDTHHHPQHEWRSDATCNGQPQEDADHSPVCGLSCAGREISCAGCANMGIQFSIWLTMVPQTKSWQQLNSPSIHFPVITKCQWRGGNVTEDYGSGNKGLRSQK